jgi:hypothetical protein
MEWWSDGLKGRRKEFFMFLDTQYSSTPTLRVAGIKKWPQKGV